MFNILPNRQDSWYACSKQDQQNCQRKSAEQKPGLPHAINKLKFNKRVDHTNSITRPKAFGRLRPVSSLLGLISQSQTENLQQAKDNADVIDQYLQKIASFESIIIRLYFNNS